MTAFALFILLLSSTAQPVKPTAPVCDTPSHDRLIVQADRDVCGPTLDRRQRPMAMGFLPTRCAQDGMIYRIDAIERRDLCVAPGK